MPEYLAPGVYVEEVSFRSKSIEGVSTTTTAFVGPTRYGPLYDPPDVLTSLADFEAVYGDGQPLRLGQATGRQLHLARGSRLLHRRGTASLCEADLPRDGNLRSRSRSGWPRHRRRRRTHGVRAASWRVGRFPRSPDAGARPERACKPGEHPAASRRIRQRRRARNSSREPARSDLRVRAVIPRPDHRPADMALSPRRLATTVRDRTLRATPPAGHRPDRDGHRVGRPESAGRHRSDVGGPAPGPGPPGRRNARLDERHLRSDERRRRRDADHDRRRCRGNGTQCSAHPVCGLDHVANGATVAVFQC